jgi:hypothetical protein
MLLPGKDATFASFFPNIESCIQKAKSAVRYADEDEKQAQNGTRDLKRVRLPGRLPVAGMLDVQDCSSEAHEAQDAVVRFQRKAG